MHSLYLLVLLPPHGRPNPAAAASATPAPAPAGTASVTSALPSAVERPSRSEAVRPPLSSLQALLPPPAASAARPSLLSASRRAQCTSGPASSALNKPRGPLLVSEAAARKRRSFHTETPVPTRALDLSLLPRSSRLDDNGFGPRGRCAVVGASGSLLSARHGAFIDSHDQVFRVNRVRTRGFEEHVGTRTTANLFWGHAAHVTLYDAQQSVLPPARRAIGLVVPAKAKDIAFYFDAVANRSRGRGRGGGGGRGGGAASQPPPPSSPPPLLLVEPRVYVFAVAALCAATHNGRDWPAPSAVLRPSTGMIAAVFAMQACRNVSLFGLRTQPPCAPHHYFDSPPARCTSAVPSRYDHSFHWFEKEHEILAQWAGRAEPAEGLARVTVY